MIVCEKPIDLSSFDLTTNNVKIKRTESIRYLGVQLDEKLSWKFHVENLKKKIQKMWINFQTMALRSFIYLSDYTVCKLSCIFFNVSRNHCVLSN